MRRSTAGFTLLEMAVVIAIVGILAATVIPATSALRRRAQHSAVLREIAGTVKRARSLAASGQQIPGTPPQRGRFAAIEFPNNRTYQLVVDADTDPNNSNSQVVAIFPFGAGDDEAGLSISVPTAGPGVRVTIASNGMVVGTNTIIEVRDDRSNPPRLGQVIISQSGATRILYNKY